MGKWIRRLRSRECACTLWVALCFALTSAMYLSWLSRLMILSDGATPDWLSMVAGYLFQAAGMGLVSLWLRRHPDTPPGWAFAGTLALFAVICAPTLLTDTLLGAAVFGMLMNRLCGIIAGFYLSVIALNASVNRRSLIFGGGYAAATIMVGLLSLTGGELMHQPGALLIYMPLALLLIPLTKRLGILEAREEAPAAPDPAQKPSPLLLACGVALLLSAVKDLGFVFPSADIAAGVVPELSRLPYALGLAVAGCINDRNRKNGMICTIAALIIPFIMLGLTSEPVPATICWGLDYLFYGFFSVFRVVLFIDISRNLRRKELAPLGLLMGRLGDAAGTTISLLLTGHKIALIATTALAFFPAPFLFIRLFQKLYEPEKSHQHTEQEVFEAFCLQYDLSSREREVLRMVIDNHSNGEISDALFISESTVKYHVRNVLQKAGCKNRVELQKKYTLALYPHLESTAQVIDRRESR